MRRRHDARLLGGAHEEHQVWLEEQGRVRRARADRAVVTRRANGAAPAALEVELLGIAADILKGGRHCRATVAKKTGRSLSTADRWLSSIERLIPGARRAKAGKVAWISVAPPKLSGDQKERLRSPSTPSGVVPLQLPLSGQSLDLLAQLVEQGIYGRTAPEVAARFIDRALVETMVRRARP